MPDKTSEPKDVDYLHPEGQPQRPPHTGEEARNEKKAEESTELAKELVVDDDESAKKNI